MMNKICGLVGLAIATQFLAAPVSADPLKNDVVVSQARTEVGEWRENRGRYKLENDGKIMELTGTIDVIDVREIRGGERTIAILLVGSDPIPDWGVYHAVCTGPAERLIAVVDKNEGDRLTVRGTFDAFSPVSGFFLEDCTLPE